MTGPHSVFPARAGMIPGPVATEQIRVGIPRESGDDPGRLGRIMAVVMYSPRERG